MVWAWDWKNPVLNTPEGEFESTNNSGDSTIVSNNTGKSPCWDWLLPETLSLKTSPLKVLKSVKSKSINESNL